MHAGRGLVFLLVVTAALVSQLETLIVSAALLPFVATLLAAQIDREGGRLARALVSIAARLLPRCQREDELEVWLDHLATAGEHGVLPLTRALSIACIAAPMLAVGLRIGRSERRAAR